MRSTEAIFKAHAGLTLSGHGESLPANWRRIEINNLTFSYAEAKADEHLFSNLELTLQRGRAIAFVGESGSGKSTLLAVLRGLQRAQSGEVVCDGVPISGGLQSVGECTTLIPQDPEIFADTIRFNVCMGLQASDAEVLAAIKLARFQSVLDGLPRGLDTNIAEKGVNLSGGEKQRLALARGIFFSKQSDIVLLDESTSSVDVFNERLIYQGLLKLFRDRCVVSAIHKFHLLPHFDEIFVFSRGALVERGGFDELIEKRGEFHRLWTSHQFDDAQIGD